MAREFSRDCRGRALPDRFLPHRLRGGSPLFTCFARLDIVLSSPEQELLLEALKLLDLSYAQRAAKALQPEGAALRLRGDAALKLRERVRGRLREAVESGTV